MTWGCKQKPNGCGWASWQEYPGLGQREWWCDLCERTGVVAVEITEPVPAVGQYVETLELPA